MRGGTGSGSERNDLFFEILREYPYPIPAETIEYALKRKCHKISLETVKKTLGERVETGTILMTINPEDKGVFHYLYSVR